MKTKSIILAGSILLFGLLALGLLAAPAAALAAPAAGPAAEKTPNPWKETLTPVRETLAALPTPDDALLENLLAREKLALSNQETRLALSHTVAETTQAFIDHEKEAGKDPAALESALGAFNQAVVQAEADHAEAAGLLASPAGFDSAGQVTDRAAARQTVRTAGQALRRAHLALTQASLNLRLAVRDYLGK